ncbi:hypothetical protein PsYK624_137400 [Phanerochaete sordida]|uniref:Zn(2)-C6 fungal-type domain-containing protein n=1 Tax=Phanerochaete sordida TaxID=48140 RepID=A0A9P3GQB5_9APHY|nr:hypothetical protein PsYK624_137400 [Phanerochaete sordida]
MFPRSQLSPQTLISIISLQATSTCTRPACTSHRTPRPLPLQNDASEQRLDRHERTPDRPALGPDTRSVTARARVTVTLQLIFDQFSADWRSSCPPIFSQTTLSASLCFTNSTMSPRANSLDAGTFFEARTGISYADLPHSTNRQAASSKPCAACTEREVPCTPGDLGEPCSRCRSLSCYCSHVLREPDTTSVPQKRPEQPEAEHAAKRRRLATTPKPLSTLPATAQTAFTTPLNTPRALQNTLARTMNELPLLCTRCTARGLSCITVIPGVPCMHCFYDENWSCSLAVRAPCNRCTSVDTGVRCTWTPGEPCAACVRANKSCAFPRPQCAGCTARGKRGRRVRCETPRWGVPCTSCLKRGEECSLEGLWEGLRERESARGKDTAAARVSATGSGPGKGAVTQVDGGSTPAALPPQAPAPSIAPSSARIPPPAPAPASAPPSTSLPARTPAPAPKPTPAPAPNPAHPPKTPPPPNSALPPRQGPPPSSVPAPTPSPVPVRTRDPRLAQKLAQVSKAVQSTSPPTVQRAGRDAPLAAQMPSAGVPRTPAVQPKEAATETPGPRTADQASSAAVSPATTGRPMRAEEVPTPPRPQGRQTALPAPSPASSAMQPLSAPVQAIPAQAQRVEASELPPTPAPAPARIPLPPPAPAHPPAPAPAPASPPVAAADLAPRLAAAPVLERAAAPAEARAQAATCEAGLAPVMTSMCAHAEMCAHAPVSASALAAAAAALSVAVAKPTPTPASPPAQAPEAVQATPQPAETTLQPTAELEAGVAGSAPAESELVEASPACVLPAAAAQPGRAADVPLASDYTPPQDERVATPSPPYTPASVHDGEFIVPAQSPPMVRSRDVSPDDAVQPVPEAREISLVQQREAAIWPVPPPDAAAEQAGEAPMLDHAPAGPPGPPRRARVEVLITTRPRHTLKDAQPLASASAPPSIACPSRAPSPAAPPLFLPSDQEDSSEVEPLARRRLLVRRPLKRRRIVESDSELSEWSELSALSELSDSSSDSDYDTETPSASSSSAASSPRALRPRRVAAQTVPPRAPTRRPAAPRRPASAPGPAKRRRGTAQAPRRAPRPAPTRRAVSNVEHGQDAARRVRPMLPLSPARLLSLLDIQEPGAAKWRWAGALCVWSGCTWRRRCVVARRACREG